jgi:hypothetical protein
MTRQKLTELSEEYNFFTFCDVSSGKRYGGPEIVVSRGFCLNTYTKEAAAATMLHYK